MEGGVIEAGPRIIPQWARAGGAIHTVVPGVTLAAKHHVVVPPVVVVGLGPVRCRHRLTVVRRVLR